MKFIFIYFLFFLEYEITNNNNNYYSCVVGDKRNETINNMRQQVIHQDPHSASGHNIPPSSSSNGRTSENTQSRIANGSQNGNNRLGGGYDCTDEAQNQKCSGNMIATSSFYPTKTQMLSGSNGPTLERVTQFHTSHIQQQQNNNTFSMSKGKQKFLFSISSFLFSIKNCRLTIVVYFYCSIHPLFNYFYTWLVTYSIQKLFLMQHLNEI